MSAPYLSFEDFKSETLMPPEHVLALEARSPGWIARMLLNVSRWVDMYLGKRYSVPFASPYPRAVSQWVLRIGTLKAYSRLGFDPSNAEMQTIVDDAKAAEDEVKAAADGQLGLIDLPLSDAQAGSGIRYGGPRVYSEASPYVGADRQRADGRREDRNRRGT